MENTLPPIRELFDDDQWKMLDPSLKAARECFERDGACLEVIIAPTQSTIIGCAGDKRSDINKAIENLSRKGFTIHIAEAWMTHPRRIPESGEFLRPRDDPERREFVGVMVFADAGKRVVGIRAEISRTAGRPPTLGPWEALADTARGASFEHRRQRSSSET